MLFSYLFFNAHMHKGKFLVLLILTVGHWQRLMLSSKNEVILVKNCCLTLQRNKLLMVKIAPWLIYYAVVRVKQTLSESYRVVKMKVIEQLIDDAIQNWRFFAIKRNEVECHVYWIRERERERKC